MTPDHHALLRFSGRPLAIAPPALYRLRAAAPSCYARPPMLPAGESDRLAPRGYVLTEAGIALVPVIGPLVSRADWLSDLLGATSHGAIGDAVAAALAEPQARAVLLEIDSPGGEVGGLFDLVERLGALRAEAGKPLWAAASESALSAAYALGSTADRLYVSRTGEVGSLGVVAIHVDESGADEMAGLSWTLIHAGAKKVDGNPHRPLSPGARADIQADVDMLHAELVALVARNRDMSSEALRATEAAIYRGRRGIEAGLADRVGPLDQALADLAATLAAPRPRPIGLHGTSAPSPSPTRSTSAMILDHPPETTRHPSPEDDLPATSEPSRDEAEPFDPPSPAPPPSSASGAPAAEDGAQHLRAEYAEIAAIAAQAGRLGVTIDAADAMAKAITPEALRREVLDTLSRRAEASALVAAPPRPTAAGDSPILRRARARAAASHS